MRQPNDYSNVQDEGLYFIRNHRNGLIYIGETNSVSARLGQHYRALVQNRHENARMQADWNAQDGRDFSFNPLLIQPTESRKVLERRYIDLYQAENPQYGYNNRPGNYKRTGTIGQKRSYRGRKLG